MSPTKKKTRAELVKALRELQGIIGQIGACYGNDRARDRAQRMNDLTEQGFNIAVNALATDPPEGPVHYSASTLDRAYEMAKK